MMTAAMSIGEAVVSEAFITIASKAMKERMAPARCVKLLIGSRIYAVNSVPPQCSDM